jgi:SAM-dependent methyltransferase
MITVDGKTHFVEKNRILSRQIERMDSCCISVTLRSSPDNNFDGDDHVSPPMPLLAGHFSVSGQKDGYSIILTGSNTHIPIKTSPHEWATLTLHTDRALRLANVYLGNQKIFSHPLPETCEPHFFVLGRGFNDRFWKGDIESIRIHNGLATAEKLPITNIDSPSDFDHFFVQESVEEYTAKRPDACPVCDSRLIAYMRHVPAAYTRRSIPLYYCLECESFFNPSGFRENYHYLNLALDWHLRVEERNAGFSRVLMEELKKRYPTAKNVLEIGCGIGTTLQAARGCFERVRGYDLNSLAIACGKAKFGLDLRDALWRYDEVEQFDLILCISVLEHLEQPFGLFKELAAAAAGKSLFVSVPILNRDRWHFVLDPDPKLPKTPFAQNDCHVTHFSEKGLLAMAQRCGMSSWSQLIAGAWHGYVLEFQKSKEPTISIDEENESQCGSAAQACRQGEALGHDEVTREAANQLPERSRALVVVGTLAARRGDLAGAEEFFRRAIEVDSSCGNAWLSLGLLLWGRGKQEDAWQAVQRSVGVDPLNREAVRIMEDMAERLDPAEKVIR